MKTKRILAAIAALTIVCGAIPTQPFANVINEMTITASAEDVTYDAEYNINEDSVIISKDGTYRIYGDGTVVKNTITVSAGVSAKITLENVNIDASAKSDGCAFKIEDNSTGNVTVTLVGSNSLKSGKKCAGLQKNGTGEKIGTLTIEGTGTLDSYGGTGIGGAYDINSNNSCSNIIINGGVIIATASYFSGIGGGYNGNGENITVNGGIVMAYGMMGAGIGGGYDGNGENIIINGGTVTASSYYSTGIGGGMEAVGKDIFINGGSVNAMSVESYAIGSCNQPVTPKNSNGDFVYPLIIENPDSKKVYIDGVEYSANHSALDENDTNLYAYATATVHTVVVGSTVMYYSYNPTSRKFEKTGDIENGTDFTVSATNQEDSLVSGTDYTYYKNPDSSATLTILSSKPITISGRSVTDTIVVASGVSANITLEDVTVDVSSIYDTCAFMIADDSKGNVNIELVGTNTLKSGGRCAGLQKNSFENAGTLTISGSGKLTAIGGSSSAGIGGGYNNGCSNLIINSGTIIANGGEYGAGIGGGYIDGPKTKNIITINGGIVTATAVYAANGIGSGHVYESTRGESLTNVTINGGSVKAIASSSSYAIGGVNSNGKYQVIPTDSDGNELYLFEIPNPDEETVTINGNTYPSSHSDEKKIYAYLPAKSADSPNVVRVGTSAYCCYYDESERTWCTSVCIPDDDSTDFTYDGNEQTYDITENEFYTVSGNKQTNAGTYTVTVSLKDGYIWSDGTNEDKEYSFVINKATPDVKAPTPKELLYKGKAQELIIAGATDFGEIVYSLDGKNFSAEIPKATDKGIYTVYYKVEDSDNWNGTEAESITVEIAELITGSCGENAAYEFNKFTGKLKISGTGAIGERAFDINWSDKIKEIEIESGITKIEKEAFYGCSSLENITAPCTLKNSESTLKNGCNATVIYNHVLADSFETCACGEQNAEPCGDNAWYLFDEETGKLTISGTGEIYRSAFDHDDFDWVTAIKEVVIEGEITEIGWYAFWDCSNLEKVTITADVTSVGKDAFNGTAWLEAKQKENPIVVENGLIIDLSKCEGNITLPDSITYICEYAFETGENITDVTIPNTVTNIAPNAFYECEKLETVAFAENSQIKSIGENAFYCCSALKEIKLPNSVENIEGSFVFYGCTKLAEITAPCSLNRNDSLMYAKSNFNTTVTYNHVGTEVIDKAEEATCTVSGFTQGSHCSECGETIVERELIPASHQFVNGICTVCGEHERIPGNCGELSFGNYSLNARYSFDRATGILTIEGYGIIGENVSDTWEEWADEVKEIIIDERITKIGDNAFSKCTSLTDITVPCRLSGTETNWNNRCNATVTYKHVFAEDSDACECDEKVERYITGSCGENATYVFDKATGTLTISGTGVIGESAFDHNLNTWVEEIEKVIIGDGITSIGERAFLDCTSLATVEMNSVTSIGNDAFYNCLSLETVEMNSVTSIGEYAFRDCSSLETVEMNSVTSIGNEAFRDCSSLETVEMNSVLFISYFAFFGCSSLTDIKAPCKVKWDESDWKAGCNATVTYKHLSDGVEICERCRYSTDNCGAFNEETDTYDDVSYKLDRATGTLTISGTGAIGEGAFANNKDITSVEIGSGITSIKYGAFSDCLLLESVEMNSVTSIGKGAFDGCSSLKSVEMNSVTSIGKGAFDGCTSLTSVTLGSTIPTGFNKIPAFAKLIIPAEAYESYKRYEEDGYNFGFSDIKGIGYILEGQIGIRLATDLSADKLVVMCGEKTIDLTQKNGYVEFFVAAQDMAKEYTVYYVDGEIEIAKFNPKNNLSGYEDTEYKAVAEALITYCEAANAYFNDGTVEDYSSEWESVKSAIGENTVDMGENYYGSSLLLESDTILRHYCTEEVAGYTGIKGDYYYIDETVDPTKFAATGTYSVNDYIYKALTSEKADTNLKNLCVALYKYGVVAEAFKNGGNN